MRGYCILGIPTIVVFVVGGSELGSLLHPGLRVHVVEKQKKALSVWEQFRHHCSLSCCCWIFCRVSLGSLGFNLLRKAWVKA